MDNGSGIGGGVYPAAGPLTLGSRLDLSTVGALAAQIGERRGTDLTIDAGGVDHLGALGAQLLLAARHQWDADGQRLGITPRSAAFDAALAALGLSEQFLAGAAQ